MQGDNQTLLEFLNRQEGISCLDFACDYIFDDGEFIEIFDNLVNSCKLKEAIFFGTMIFKKEAEQTLLVDGLQRILTINLLLVALCNSYGNTSEKNRLASEKIKKMYLFSLNGIKFSYSSVFEKLVTGKDLTKREKMSNIYLAYEFFLRRICEKRISATDLFKTISKIEIIPIFTEETELRELYNAVNPKLAVQIKLINNFLLSAKNEKSGLWLNTISVYTEEFLTMFMRDFITIQNNGRIPTEKNLYNDFKVYYKNLNRFRNFEQIISEINKFVGYYEKIINADFEAEEIKAEFELINSNSAVDTYPYLMEVLNDLEEGNINEEILSDILKLVNMFIKDRENAEPSSVTINFAGLSKSLNRMLFLREQTPKILHSKMQRDFGKITINDIMSA